MLLALKTTISGNNMELHLVYRRTIKDRLFGETVANINRHFTVGECATPDPLAVAFYCNNMCQHKK